MGVYTTLSVEFLLILSSILIFYKFRSKIGFAPLYILLGSLQYLQTLAGTIVSVKIINGITLYPGSAIIFCAGLFTVLLIYIKEGVVAARNLIFGIVISNLLLITFFAITYQQELAGGISSIDSTSIFFINNKNFILGTTVLLLDFILMVIIYQFLISKIKNLHFFLVVFISLFSTLIFDAFAFNFALFYGTPIFENSLISHLIVKPIAALVFSVILYLYVKYVDNEKPTTFIENQDRDIFSIINYKQKYEDLKIEKIRVEQKLTSELETALQNISDGFVSLDTKWCYTYINKKAAALLGKLPENLIGKHIWTEFPEGIDLSFYKAYHKALETQETIYFEDYYEPLDTWFENRVYPSPEGLTIYFTDITEKKKTDINNQMLLSLIETSDDFVGLASLEGKPTYLNVKGRTLVGLDTNDALPDSIANFFPINYQEVIAKEHLPNIFKNNKWNGKAKFKNFKTGDLLPIEMSGFLIRNSITSDPIALGIVATDIAEREKAEEALKESENHLRTILETEPECIKQLNANGELIYMNPAGLAMIEADNLEMVKGQKVSNLVNPIHQQAFKKLLIDVFKGNSGRLEFEIKGIKGTNRWLETHAVPFKDKDGNIISLLGVTHDVTERKETEEKLINSEQLFRRLTSNAPVGIFQTDKEGTCNYVNEAWLKSAGMTFEEAMGFGFANAMHPEDREHVLQAWQQFVEKGNEFNIEFRFQNIKTNEITWQSVKAVRLYDSNKAIYGFIGMLVDITDRKKANEQIIKSEKYLDNIINNIGDPVFVKDEESRFVSANDAFYSFFNFSKSDVLGKTLAENLPIDEMEGFLSLDKQVLSTGVENITEETITLNDNETRFISTKKTRYIDDSGNKYLIGVSRDITDQKKAEKEILALGKRNTLIIETVLDGFILADTTGKILDANPAYVNMIGYTQAELLTMNINELEFELTQQQIDARIDEMVSKGFTRFQSNHKKKNGEIINIDVNTFAMQINEQYVVAAFMKNITEQKIAEIAIKENSEKFSKAFESNVIGKAILNKEKTIIEVNEALASIVGFKRENMLGKTALEIGLFNFDSPENLENENKLWSEFGEKGYVSNIELNYLLQSGKELFILISLQALKLNNEDHVLITVLDITEKKHVEAELEKHRNNLEELVELRTEEVNSKNNELQRMNKLFVGRELKMKELKNIIKEMELKNDN